MLINEMRREQCDWRDDGGGPARGPAEGPEVSLHEHAVLRI